MSDFLSLNTLTNSSRPFKRRKLLGRGPGSKSGKTCGRGIKGAGSRSGWKARHGTIGGGVPLHRKVPTRGFTNGQFKITYDVINLGLINEIYSAGETVSYETLRLKGVINGPSRGIKILGDGELTKKVSFQVSAFSASAKEKLKALGIEV